MRVLHWIVPYFPTVGGRERFVERLSSDLRERGHHVGIVCPAPPAADGPIAELHGIPHFLLNPYLHLFPNRGDASSMQIERLIDFAQENSFQLIHIHNHSSLDLGLAEKLSSTLGIPALLTLHGPWVASSQRSSPSGSRLAFVSNFVAISEHVFQASSTSLADGQRLTLIPNGIPIPPIKGGPRDAEFLYAGRLSPEKGIPQLLAAFKLFSDMNTEVKLRIVGSGPQESLLRQIVKTFGLLDRVRFEGWQNEAILKSKMSKALAVFVPSLWEEPFGLVAAEAMALETVVVHSSTGGLAEVVGVDGDCGYSFRNGDVVRLVSIMNEIVANPSNLAKMGERARERATRLYSQERMVDQYEDLYRDMTTAAINA